MFENRIINTKLSGSLADCMFRRINGSDYEGDWSFVATLRALLMSRLQEGDGITFRYFTYDLEHPTEDLANEFAAAAMPNTINYLAVTAPYDISEEENKQKFFSIPIAENFHEFMDVREFFAQKMCCRAFINEQIRSSVIVVLESNIKKHHLAQCIIPKLLPWYFERGKISAVERQLLYGLRDRRDVMYQAAIELLCDTEEFRHRSTAAAFSSYKKKSLEKQKTRAEREISRRQDTIERLNSQLLSELRCLSQDNFTLNGILIALESDVNVGDEFMQFMANNKNVEFIDMDGDQMRIQIKGYLDIYDPEAYRSLARNPNAWYWTNSATSNGPFMVRDNRKMVMDAIFSDNPTFKIKTYGRYKLDLEHGGVSGGGTYEDADTPADRYANPHLYYASCLGSYYTLINKALMSGDMIGAISNCIASTHSVNVTESATFRHLCRDIFERNTPILEGPDGQSYTTKQAYEYLVKQKNKEQHEGE